MLPAPIEVTLAPGYGRVELPPAFAAMLPLVEGQADGGVEHAPPPAALISAIMECRSQPRTGADSTGELRRCAAENTTAAS
jgi:hypothetical protein